MSPSKIEPLPPEIRTVGEMLAHRVRWSPEALAFAADGARLTYAALAADAGALAGGLAALGVERGARVALFLPAGLDFIRFFYALQRLGATPCAFDPKCPPATAARRARRARPALVVVAGDEAGELHRACAAAGLSVAHIADVHRSAGTPPPPARSEADDPAYLQPTSGTSGEPRLAVLSQRNVMGYSRAGIELEIVGALVSWVPPWHDLGLVRFVIGAPFAGEPCYLVPPAIRTLDAWLHTAARMGATVIGAPDFAYRLATRLVSPEGLDLSALRYAIDGGEPVRHTTIAAFEQRFGISDVVRPAYGLAEATLGVTWVRPGEPLCVDVHGNVACGRPGPGIEVRIDGPPGEPGEILVRGVSVFAGYFDADEASREALRGGWLHTGDIGSLDAGGNLYVLGRKRALLKRGGAPLAPRELEEVAEQVPGVRLAAAVALPAGEGGASEEIVVVVETETPTVASPSALAAAVSAAVAAAVGFAPEVLLVLAPRSIPRTPNGKVRHGVLRQSLAQGDIGRSGSLLYSSSASRVLG